MSITETMAEEINKKALGLKAGTVEIWGIQPVRPDDWLFVIVGSKGEDGRLDLLVDDKTQGEGQPSAPYLTISLWEPQGLRTSKKKLEIASASRVTWGKDFQVARKGETLEVSTGNQKAQPRDLRSAPALVLR